MTFQRGSSQCDAISNLDDRTQAEAADYTSWQGRLKPTHGGQQDFIWIHDSCNLYKPKVHMSKKSHCQCAAYAKQGNF